MISLKGMEAMFEGASWKTTKSSSLRALILGRTSTTTLSARKA